MGISGEAPRTVGVEVVDMDTLCTEFARQVRCDVIKILHRSKDSHIGTCFSCIDILSVLYNAVLNIDPQNPNMENRDIFIMSKGHGAAAIYSTLARRGYYSVDLLETYCKNGSDLAGHVRKFVVPGIECSAGSLGHGLSLATGIGYANRLKKSPGRVFVLMGDGECNEGSVWEAAMLAAFHKLSNVVAIIDRNRLQSYNSDEKVLNMGDMGEKFRAFGWRTADISGHDIPLLIKTLQNASIDVPAPPMAVIAHTIKGKGVSFMENRLEWHFKSPNDEELDIGLRELMK